MLKKILRLREKFKKRRKNPRGFLSFKKSSQNPEMDVKPQLGTFYFTEVLHISVGTDKLQKIHKEVKFSMILLEAMAMGTKILPKSGRMQLIPCIFYWPCISGRL